jgi:hypothetical protein
MSIINTDRNLSKDTEIAEYLWDGQEEEDIPQDVRTVKIVASAQQIPLETFFARQFLVNVDMPRGLTMIGSAVFLGCTSLERVKVPSTVEVIGYAAFKLCTALVDINLPNLQSLSDDTFEGCASLKYIDIPSSVEHIGRDAFRSCSKLASAPLPSRLFTMEEGAFVGCERLTHIRIPKSLKRISSGTFSECTSLKSVELHEEIEFIAFDAFEGCISLVNIYFPNMSDTAEIDFKTWGCDSLNTEFGNNLEYILQTRFEGLPLHRLCYYQGHNDEDKDSDAPDSLTKLGRSLFYGAERYYPTLKMQDKFGMTALHILSMSTKPNLELCKELVERAPENLVTLDKWGNVPSDNMLFNMSPGSSEVLVYLCSKFQEQGMYRLGLEKWKDDLRKEVQVLGGNLLFSPRMRQSLRITLKTELYVIKEFTSLLELALWKGKMNEFKSALSCARNQQTKKVKRDKVDSGEMRVDAVDRKICRKNSKSQIIIPLVLPFLWRTTEKLRKRNTRLIRDDFKL